MVSSISGLSLISKAATASSATGASGNEPNLAELQSTLSAKKAKLALAKTDAEKAALQAEIALIEKQIEELKAKRKGAGEDSAQAKAAEELAKLFTFDTSTFNENIPFGERQTTV